MRTMFRLLALGAVLLSSLVSAQERGFALQRYAGPSAGSGLFLLERPWYSSTRFFAVGITADYSHNPLQPTVLTGRGPLTPIVSNAFVGHLDLAGSLFDRLLLSASLPVSFLEQGTPELVSQVAPLQAIGVGDPRVGLMVRLAGQADRDPFSVHLGADVWIPIGAAATHQGDSGVRLLPRAVFAGAFGAGRYTVDLGFLYRPYASFGPPALGLVAAPEARAGVALGISLAGDRLYLGPEAQFAMQVLGDQAFAVKGMSLELLGGVNYRFGDTVLLGVAGGAGFFGAAGTPDARAIVRLAFAPRRSVEPKREEVVVVQPQKEDADLDGVSDALDRCPFEPETKNGVRDADGCPEFEMEPGAPLARVLASQAIPPPALTLVDAGVLRIADAGLVSRSPPAEVDAGVVPLAGLVSRSSPAEGDAGVLRVADAGAVSLSLPAEFGRADSDGDGVVDEADRCPVTPEDPDGFEDEDGCPEADNDGDAVADSDDKCPVEAESINGVADGDGCPDLAPDADKDGVADAIDRCPFEPEILDGVRDEDGCPEFASPSQPSVSKLLVEIAVTNVPVPAVVAVAVQLDSDRDGVPDDEDRCPVTAEDRDGFEDDDGCAELDNDDDGVVDTRDRCPDVAETLNGYKDDDGCADENPDVDGDGVDYENDRCPLEPGTLTALSPTLSPAGRGSPGSPGSQGDGCPHLPLPALALPGFALPLGETPAVSEPSTADFDRDGTPDEADGCPAVAEDRDGFEDEDGCAEPDNDRDGIPDAKDKCPFEAETINGQKDDDGCPDPGAGLVHVRAGAVVIDDVVRFKPASANLERTAPALLKQVAATLRAAASLSIEIQGHTDDTGSAAANIKLSQRRAETIRAFLVKAGVASNRLVAKGFGPTKPRATNKTAEGREQNRRVEFLIMGEAK